MYRFIRGIINTNFEADLRSKTQILMKEVLDETLDMQRL